MKDEHLVHRLEAFSDIVMGFVLAEMAITLAIPRTVPTLNAVFANLLAFAVTFGLVAIVWTMHTRLFATYFVPNPLMIVLNFVMLAGLVIMGYIFSLAMHFNGQAGFTTLFGSWFCCFAAVYMLLAAMYGIGTYLRRAKLTPHEFSSGVERVVGATFGSAALVYVGITFPHLHHVNEVKGVYPYVAALALIAFLARALIRRRMTANRVRDDT